MDVKPEQAAPARPAPAAGELIVQGGRQAGVRRTLNVPLTFIGRAPGCDVRLNAEGISPLHCLIAQSATGAIVRDLDSASGTLVNGQRVTVQPLHDGDTLTVGPFQFRLHLAPVVVARPPAPIPAPVPAEPRETNKAEKDALRIQAAAVAAQQSVLLEEETRLQQQRGTLEQQESQLATHLEEKRGKLVKLTEEARAARDALHKERTAYQQHVERVTRDLSTTQRELLDSQQSIQKERQRLGVLHKKLKERAERQLKTERANLRQRDAKLAATQKEVEQQQERLRQERETLRAERLRFNGDCELGRRQLQDARQQFQQEQQQARAKLAQDQAAQRQERKQLEKQVAALRDARRVLEDQQYAWEAKLRGLTIETNGLEQRIANQRLKLIEQQQQLDQLAARPAEAAAVEDVVEIPEVIPDAVLAEPTAANPTAEASATEQPATAAAQAPETPEPPLPAQTERERQLLAQEQALHKRLAALEKLAGDLTDQRAQLAEQWERLAQTQHQWQQERLAATTDLEAAVAGFPEREQALTERQQSIEATEDDLRRRQEELLLRGQQLETWGAKLRVEEASWRSERDQLIADLQGREEVAERHLMALVDLRQRWAKRRRQELDLLRAERARCEKLRKECVSMREDLWQRGVILEDERRNLSEKTLMLETYKQETILRASDAAAAEKRVERLRMRWRTQHAGLLTETEAKRQLLFAESAKLEERQTALQQQLESLAVREANLAQRQTTWEQAQTQAEADQEKLRHQLHSAQGQRDRQEQQIRELREEVERVARVLFDETAVETQPVLRAA